MHGASMRAAWAAAVSRRPSHIACGSSSSPLWALQPRRASSVHCGRVSQATSGTSSSHASSRHGRRPRRGQPNARHIAPAAETRFSASSYRMGCNHIADRVKRRRQLEDAIQAAQAFRKWCAVHAPCTQAAVGASVSATTPLRPGELSPSHAPVLHRVGGSVATLADIGSDEGASSRTTRHHLGFRPPTTPTTNPPLTAGGAVPLTERRMLEHYAVLLHNVRAAAARVATSDYHHFYAAVVEELLMASKSGGGSGAFSVPRSVVWQDAAASTYHGESEDATAQAERRLAAWASYWYKDLKQWYSRHGTHTPGAGNAVDAQQLLPHGELWQDVLDGGEGVVGTREEDKSMAALLLQGQWRAAIDSLLEASAKPPRSASAAAMVPNGSSTTASQQLSVAELFSAASVRRRHCVPWRHSPHRGSANSSSSTLPPLPRRLALAPVTPAELRLLRHPPSPGLRVLPHSIAAKVQRAGCQERPAGDRVAAAPSLLLEAAVAAEVAGGRATGIPPTCVVRLRRRLWVLQHLPRHLPASLVRFQEPRQPSLRAGGGRGREVRSGAMPHAHLLRSHALEKLPWYTLCVLGEVLEASGNGDPTVATVLHNARTHMCAALFLSVHADYAALHDYAHTLFLTLGSSMVARAVAARQRQRGRSDGGAAVTVFESAFAQTAIALLQPPPPAAYAAAGLSPRPASSSGNAASFLARSSSARTPSSSTDITDVHVVPPRVFRRLCAAVQDWRNYHLSLYCETLSQIADSDGMALRELARVLAAQPHGEDALQEEVAVVLAPESAAAIVTALLLQLLDQLSRPSASPSSTTTRAPLSFLSNAARTAGPHTSAGCDPQGASPSLPPLPPDLCFCVPHDKAHAVASYFKGIFHPSFFRRVVTAAPRTNGDECQLGDDGAAATSTITATITAGARTADELNGNASALPSFVLPPAEWERNAAARLVGRTLRRLDRYPTRTTEAFFARYVRGDDVDWKREVGEEGGSEAAAARSASTTVAPPLAMSLFVVNLQAAVNHWRERHRSPILGVPPPASSHAQQQEQVSLPAQPSVNAAGDGRTADTPLAATAAATPTGAEASLTEAGKDGLPDSIVLLASPPMLPHGLHAVYKPAGVNCTLHAHYPSLVYPFLTRELPWKARGAVAADGSDRNRGTSASSSPAPCVPVLRQQGLVNRVDVGTSGVVLVARTADALHGAADAMIREHHMRKTYRALVQRWPPFSSSSSSSASTVRYDDDNAAAAPLFSVSPFLSPMPSAVVCAPVYAAGATASSISRRSALPLSHGRQLQSPGQPSADALAASRAGSTLSWSSSVPVSLSSLEHVHQQYATLHAALQDQRNAITRYRVLEYFASAGVAYVQVELCSGRRHQIRQHFAQLGFPLVGDARYHAGVVAGHAGTTLGMRRAALHAYTVDILATTDGDDLASSEEVPDRVVVQAALPADMHRALLALRQAEQAKPGQQQQQRRQPQQPRG
ncbi:RNA pseudouridylate synthase-like protein [Leishmania major strain Friedlin]|uniref:RNA pseudouridylate synthase-like protein n=1 Tax=Leishmania major TaxID=5664 RepID=Q9U190_LEIMA|nr:RNA pseudouridylate synthase-like protein [Leishmania major strain Friedlin]CAC22676.1 RNA pseudouridylate synthase-like protein [Leishmania major strain Friedlin]CAG9567683.1 RNA_pseudouridylate_synthase-like_protein [Leishmania major strain Friedlin]|eukprot:XP_888536.1 RNA pseudouridylate synthase-like protein [Leishmania major strain Friedlin]